MATERDDAGTLRDEILAEARRESDEIVTRARREADNIVAAAEAEAARVREGELERAKLEAARRTELIRATIPLETARLRVIRIESLLEDVRERARERLIARSGFEYRDAVVALAALAINQMAGASFVVRLSGADEAVLGDGLCADIAQRSGRASSQIALSLDPDAHGGGVVVEDGETRQVCDNGLLARLERMWPELRRQIAQNASFIAKTEQGGNCE